MTHILDFKNIRKYKSDLPPSGLVQLALAADLRGSVALNDLALIQARGNNHLYGKAAEARIR